MELIPREKRCEWEGGTTRFQEGIGSEKRRWRLGSCTLVLQNLPFSRHVLRRGFEFHQGVRCRTDQIEVTDVVQPLRTLLLRERKNS